MKQMVRVTASIWLTAVITFAGVSSVLADALRADRFFLNEQQLPEIEVLGIAPSDDPWALFEAFGKRFSVVMSAEFQEPSRNIRSVAAAGRGDRATLAFLVLNLFRLNGIDTELAFLSTKRGSGQGDRRIEQMLVYVPALGQYFDPALPFDSQHNSADRGWLEGRERLHFSAALQHKGRAVGRCRDICLHAYGVRSGSDGFRDPYAVRVKTIRVPMAPANETINPK
jgi:hypothetical protein